MIVIDFSFSKTCPYFDASCALNCGENKQSMTKYEDFLMSREGHGMSPKLQDVNACFLLYYIGTLFSIPANTHLLERVVYE